MENENTKATIAKKGSFVVEVEEGKKYFWCACGLSQRQPFCDGPIRQQVFQLFPILLQNLGKFTFVDASKAAKNLYVTVPTIGSQINFT